MPIVLPIKSVAKGVRSSNGGSIHFQWNKNYDLVDIGLVHGVFDYGDDFASWGVALGRYWKSSARGVLLRGHGEYGYGWVHLGIDSKIGAGTRSFLAIQPKIGLGLGPFIYADFGLEFSTLSKSVFVFQMGLKLGDF